MSRHKARADLEREIAAMRNRMAEFGPYVGMWAVADAKNALLRKIVRDLHFLARRYADGRSSYVTRAFNEHTRLLLALGVELDLADGTPWARDRQGRAYDGLTDEEAAMGKPLGEWREKLAVGLPDGPALPAWGDDDDTIVLNRADVLEMIDREARARMGISGDEFLRRLREDDLPDTLPAQDIRILARLLDSTEDDDD